MVSRQFIRALPSQMAVGLRGTPASATPVKPRTRTFAQILGKLYFFELLENLRRILLDYEPKRTDRSNATFNAPC
jgi:hypothetical protein